MNNNKIIEKPWGQEIIWAKTKDYVGKLIFINKGHRLSRQFHKIKEGYLKKINLNILLNQ